MKQSLSKGRKEGQLSPQADKLSAIDVLHTGNCTMAQLLVNMQHAQLGLLMHNACATLDVVLLLAGNARIAAAS